MMLRDVKVKTSSLLVGCAATLLVSLSSTVAADSVHSSDRRFGVGYKEETTSQFSLELAIRKKQPLSFLRISPPKWFCIEVRLTRLGLPIPIRCI